MAKPDLKVVLSILDKMELEYSDKISLKQAKEKLERAIEDDEDILDDIDLSKNEEKGLRQMGYDLSEEEEEEGEEEEEEKKPAKKKAAPAKKKKKKAAAAEKKPAKKKAAKKEKKKKAPKKMGKYAIVCSVLKKRKKHSLEGLAEEVDALYVKNGGKSYLKGTMNFCVSACNVLGEYGILTRDKDVIKIL